MYYVTLYAEGINAEGYEFETLDEALNLIKLHCRNGNAAKIEYFDKD